MRSTASLDKRLYQAALYLYPPSFRREFSPEMVRDFDEARKETERVGRGLGLWAFRAHLSADLACTVALQWVRTGWPIIAVASVMCPLVAASALANVWPRELFVMPVGIGTHDADILALEVLVTIVLLLIVATIMVTLVLMRSLLFRRIGDVGSGTRPPRLYRPMQDGGSGFGRIHPSSCRSDTGRA